MSNLPISHSSIGWFDNESFVFLSFFQFSTIALKCGISDTVRMGSKLRKVLHFNIITLMWSYKEKSHGAFLLIPLTNCYYHYFLIIPSNSQPVQIHTVTVVICREYVPGSNYAIITTITFMSYFKHLNETAVFLSLEVLYSLMFIVL